MPLIESENAKFCYLKSDFSSWDFKAENQLNTEVLLLFIYICIVISKIIKLCDLSHLKTDFYKRGFLTFNIVVQ